MGNGLGWASLACIAAGVVLAVAGDLEYTGVMHTPLPGETVFAGMALVVIGVALHYADRHLGAYAIDAVELDAENREKIASAPDDGYLLDLTGKAPEGPGEDMPEIEDMTDGEAGE